MGFLSALISGRSIAQTPMVESASTSPLRLTVRPHHMATGTRTAKAGVATLPGLPSYVVYVPKSCVGKRRVPLVVYLHDQGENAVQQLAAQRALADMHGMILLVPNAVSPGWRDVFVVAMNYKLKTGRDPSKVLGSDNMDVRGIDAAMKQVLRTYAIDPNKIAVVGFSSGGSYALLLGRANPDIFSRVGTLSATHNPFYWDDPRNAKTRFLVAAPVNGLAGGVATMFSDTRELRDAGRNVETTLFALPFDVARGAGDAYAWHWLARSWGQKPLGTAARSPRVPPDADPVLTVAALARMTIFWSKVLQGPDLIGRTRLQANQENVIVSVGKMPVTVVTLDVAALVGKSSAVAAALNNAGLTVQQEEAYRVAVLRTELALMAPETTPPIAATSTFGQNLAFRQTHGEELGMFTETGLWTLP